MRKLRRPPLRHVYDIAVIGSGFAGSLTAMIAQRLGLSVILLERGKHPRFMIGESSTPLSNLLLDDIATRYDLPAVHPLTKWGSWQKHYPGIACGLKRGFTFYHHVLGQQDAPDPERHNQLLVAASPHNGIADTHWYRADFDMFLAAEARRLGVEYVDEVKLDTYTAWGDIAELRGKKNGRDLSFRARFLVDATGPRGFLHQALQLPEAALPQYPLTQALYAHFSGVERAACAEEPAKHPPYPADDAAVHHIFDGGWIWVLRFNNGITSAGVAATDNIAKAIGLADGADAWKRLLQLLPSLKDQFASAKIEHPFFYARQLSFQSAAVCGNHWALLPSAAGFVDPLLSTGFPLTLLGISRLADILERDWNTHRFHEQLRQYARLTTNELLATARLIAALYANMGNFSVFAALSLLYFAAASFSETARRLNKPHLASSFLLHDHPSFGPACRELLDRARNLNSQRERDQFVKDVLRAIEPVDVAGLCRQDRRNWYPVEADDLLQSASKVESTRDEIAQLLQSCGFYS